MSPKPTCLITILLDTPIEPQASTVLQSAITHGLATGQRAAARRKAAQAASPATLNEVIAEAAHSLSQASAYLAIAAEMTRDGHTFTHGATDSFGLVNSRRKVAQRRAFA